MQRSSGRTFFVSTWFRATAVSVAAFAAIVGVAQAAVTLSADIDTDGALSVGGNVTLGSGGDDTIIATGSSLSLQTNAADMIFNTADGFSVSIRGGNDYPAIPNNGNDVALLAEDDLFGRADSDVVLHSGYTAGGGNTKLIAGDGAPDAAEDGDDVVLEAEDSILMATIDDINITSGNGVDFISENQLLLNSNDGNIRLELDDSDDMDDNNILIVAGPLAPDAGEDGNDIVLEAEGSILGETSNGIWWDAATASLFRTANGDLDLVATSGSDSGDILITAGNAPPTVSEDGNDVGIETEDDFLSWSLGATVIRAGTAPESTSAGNEDVGITAVGGVYIDSGEGAGNEGITLESDGGNDAIVLNGDVSMPQTFFAGSGGSVFDGIFGSSGTVGNGGAAISANSCIEDTITATGVATGDPLIVNAPADIEAGLVWSSYISGADAVKVRLCNATTSGVTSADKTWSVTWFSLAP